MPFRDGTGPRGQGAGGFRGGRGGDLKRGSRPGAGTGGECICPSCGTAVPHQRGVPCYQVKCPGCGTNMVRK